MEDVNFIQLVLYFMVACIAGYVIEVLVYLLGRQHKLVNRGFLFGPWLPIYGFGGLIALKLYPIIPKDNLVLMFLLCAAVGAGVEYLTSWLLEKIFHMRWWDYSKTRKIQLNGRIALLNTIWFGVGGCIVFKKVLPFINHVINQIPEMWQTLIAITFLVAILADATVSIYANLKVKNMGVFSKIVGDPAGQIKKYAKLVVERIILGPQKMAALTEKQLKKAQERFEKQQQKIEAKQSAFKKKLQKRRADFNDELEKRRQAIAKLVTKKPKKN